MSELKQDYYAVITDAGSALEAQAHARGVPVKLTHIAVGDGNGEVPEPDRSATGLVNEVYRREIDSSRVDPDDPNICWISAVIPADAGGFWIREFGIYAEAPEEGGEPVLYGYGNHAPYYKVEKILGQASTHELEIPVIMTGQAQVQIAVKDAGYASQSALNGLAGQVGQMRITQNEYGARIAKLEEFDANHDIVATVEKDGHVKPDGKTISIKTDGTISVTQGSHWLLGEFYFFRHPTLREGFEVLDGGVIENGAELYPDFWQYIQTASGQLLCKTASERAELANHVYATLADGTQITYNGIGGVPFFTIDTATGQITMPDVRNMHLEMAGPMDSLNVGAVRMDQMRRIYSYQDGMHGLCHAENKPAWSGCLWLGYADESKGYAIATKSNSTTNLYSGIMFDSGRVVPSGNHTAPRRFGVLACSYMGMPAL